MVAKRIVLASVMGLLVAGVADAKPLNDINQDSGQENEQSTLLQLAEQTTRSQIFELFGVTDQNASQENDSGIAPGTLDEIRQVVSQYYRQRDILGRYTLDNFVENDTGIFFSSTCYVEDTGEITNCFKFKRDTRQLEFLLD